MKIILGTLLVALSTQLRIVIANDENDYKLELLHVLFRHGDRVAEKHEVYRNDPYDETFKRYGYGQMTISGKQRMYEVGEKLRERYSSFLADYQPQDVYARSTDTDRTKMSLLLVLAGLYPPSSATVWNESVNWLPIPIHYEAKERDFLYSFQKCERFMDLFQEQLDKIPDRVLDREFIEHVYNSTGILPASTTLLYFNLRSVLSLNLPLPNWCSPSDYKRIESFAEEAYSGVAATNLMSRMTTGPFIDKFYEDLETHASGVGARKVYLYAAHDYNIASFTRTHNFTDAPRIPDFGSTIVLETLRGRDRRLYVRVSMWASVSKRWIPLKLASCGSECPLDEYKRILENVLPNVESRVCLPVNTC